MLKWKCMDGFPVLLIMYFSVPVGTMPSLLLIYLVLLSEPHPMVLGCKQCVNSVSMGMTCEGKGQWDSMPGISLELLGKSWNTGL